MLAKQMGEANVFRYENAHKHEQTVLKRFFWFGCRRA